MNYFFKLYGKLRRIGYGALGSEYYQGATGLEVEVPIGDEGDVKTVVSGVPGWAPPAAGGLGSLQTDIAALWGQLLSKASIFSPNFRGTPTKNGVPLATTADISAGGSVDPSAISALLGMVLARAPLVNPNFRGTLTVNGAPLTVTVDNDQAILASQIFGS